MKSKKTHFEVFNVLLQILDDGRLTDGKGRTVDFKNSVVIMTSNLGSEIWQQHNMNVSRDEISKVMRQHFRPEFINRIDEIVVFHKLDKQMLAEIVEIQLKHVNDLIADKGFKLEITPEAKEYIAEIGYDPDYGARPLKRVIQREIQDPLAVKILSGAYKPGSTIIASKGAEGLVFTVAD